MWSRRPGSWHTALRLAKGESGRGKRSAPATGEGIKIKAKTTVKFRLAKAGKDAVVPLKA